MSDIEIIKRLYHTYTKKHLGKILISVFFTLLVAASTSSIAWLLDPAINKIFIEKDLSLILIIPLAIIIAFATKGISLYLAKSILIKVAQEVTKSLQLDCIKSIVRSDTEIFDKKHSGKFLSHITFDIGMITNLISIGVLYLSLFVFI